MKDFSVSFPVVLEVSTIVEAETEEEAISKAIENYDPDDQNYQVIDGGPHRKVVTGNVYHGCVNYASAEEST